MSDAIRPRHNRVTYAAMLAGFVAAAVLPLLGPGYVASAAPRSWDLELYDACLEWNRAAYQRGEITLQDLTEADHVCCVETGGVWDADKEFCRAPSGAEGTRQLPGSIQIPSDLATAPTVTTAPPRPIRNPSEIATTPVISQAPA